MTILASINPNAAPCIIFFQLGLNTEGTAIGAENRIIATNNNKMVRFTLFFISEIYAFLSIIPYFCNL